MLVESFILFLSSLIGLNEATENPVTPQQPQQPKTEIQHQHQQSHNQQNNQPDGGLQRGGWDHN